MSRCKCVTLDSFGRKSQHRSTRTNYQSGDLYNRLIRFWPKIGRKNSSGLFGISVQCLWDCQSSKGDDKVRAKRVSIKRFHSNQWESGHWPFLVFVIFQSKNDKKQSCRTHELPLILFYNFSQNLPPNGRNCQIAVFPLFTFWEWFSVICAIGSDIFWKLVN